MAIRLRRDVHYLVLGSTGSGKTEWLKRRLLPALFKQRDTYFVIVDAKGEYSDTHRNTVDVATHLDLNDALYGKEKPLGRVIRLVPDDIGQDYAESILRAAWAPYSRNAGKSAKPFAVRLILDDAPLWYRESGGRNSEQQLYRWLGTGRRYLRSGIFLAQRSQLVPKIILTESTEMTCCFKLSAYDVKRALEPIYGPVIGAAIRSLPRYGYAIISDHLPEGVEVYKPIPNKGMAKREKGVLLPDD